MLDDKLTIDVLLSLPVYIDCYPAIGDCRTSGRIFSLVTNKIAVKRDVIRSILIKRFYWSKQKLSIESDPASSCRSRMATNLLLIIVH